MWYSSIFHLPISRDLLISVIDSVEIRVTSLLVSGVKLRPLLGAFLIPPTLTVVLIWLRWIFSLFNSALFVTTRSFTKQFQNPKMVATLIYGTPQSLWINRFQNDLTPHVVFGLVTEPLYVVIFDSRFDWFTNSQSLWKNLSRNADWSWRR